MSNPKHRSRSALFWARGGAFSIIALVFLLLSFAYPAFLAPGIVFMVISLAWGLRNDASKPGPSEDQNPPTQL